MKVNLRLTAAVKGIITGVLMILCFLLTFYYGKESKIPLEYFVYGIYVLGVIWTLIAYRRSAAFTGKFGDLFAQGFRCFIVVTLIMVVFTFVFSKMHPELAENAARSYKEHLLEQKEKLERDIDEEVENVRKNYNTVVLYGSIFGYLIIGAGVTAAASGLLMRRNNS